MAYADPATATMPTDDRAISVLSDLLGGSGPARVLDLGGGTGVYAVPLAQLGHEVLVLDQSPDALATLRRRAQAASVDHLVRGDVADLDALEDSLQPRSADLVLCHRVLEYVDNPVATLRLARTALVDGGRMSVVTANRDGAVLGRIAGGRLQEAARIAGGDDSGTGKTGRRFTLEELGELVSSARLRVEASYGLGLVGELAPEASAADARALHEAICDRPALRDVSPLIHLVLVAE